MLYVIIVLFLILSAVCSAAESSLLSLSVTQTRSYANSSDPNRKLIYKLLLKPQELMVTLLMINISANLGVQNVLANTSLGEGVTQLMIGISEKFGMQGLLAQIGMGDGKAFISSIGVFFVNVIIPLFLTLVFGDILPKSLAMSNNEFLAPYMAKIISYPHKLLSFLRLFLMTIVTPVSNFFFFYLAPEHKLNTEEFRHILSSSENEGILGHGEALLIGGCLDLQDQLLRDRMKPKESVVWFDINQSLDHLEELFKSKSYSRIPVCTDNFDELLGIISAADYFFHRQKVITHSEPKEALKTILEKPFYIPASVRTGFLMRQFYQSGNELAIVVDEFGKSVGIITLEDLINVVIGPIDIKGQDKSYTMTGKNAIIAQGRLTIQEFESLFDVDLVESRNVATIAGWLITELRAIPPPGKRIELHGFLFQILDAEAHRINSMYIRKL